MGFGEFKFNVSWSLFWDSSHKAVFTQTASTIKKGLGNAVLTIPR